MARIAPTCATDKELRDRLAEEITDAGSRTTFLRSVGSEAKASAGAPAAAKPAVEITQWDPVMLANAKQQLAVYAGPIASVIVDRAAKKARNPQELYQMLSKEIAGEKDRAAFLRLAPWGK